MTTTIKKESLGVAPCAVFDTRAELTDVSCETYFRNESKQSGLSGLLLEIPGIRALWIGPYQLRIYKAECFEWDEIVPQVEEIIKGLEAVSAPEPEEQS